MANRTISAERMHKLRVFVSIIEQGSMTAAAKTLKVSRSVVSAHLKQLEDDLGVRLLERTTRSMHITHVGKQVYERARQMLNAAQAAIDVVDAHLGSVRGVLRVALPVDLGTTVLAPVVEVLRAQHPHLRIDVLVGDSPTDIVRDGIDVAIRIGVPGDSGLIMRRLCWTDKVFVASPGFVEMHKTTTDVSQLTELPRIAHSLVDLSHPTLHHPDGRTVRIALQPAVISVGTSDLIRQFAIRGLGMASVPELIVRQDIDHGDLVRIAAPWTCQRLDVYALTPSRVTSPAVQAFLQAVRTRVDELEPAQKRSA